MNGWKTTKKDVQSVLDYHNIVGIGNRVVKPTNMSADEILDIIDTDAVANAALWWGDSMEEQRERALAEIERQLLSMGILDGPRIIG